MFADTFGSEGMLDSGGRVRKKGERPVWARLEEDEAHLHPLKSSSSDRVVLLALRCEPAAAERGCWGPTATGGLKTER